MTAGRGDTGRTTSRRSAGAKPAARTSSAQRRSAGQRSSAGQRRSSSRGRARSSQRAAAARARTRSRRRVALIGLLLVAVLAAMSVGPLQSLLAATDRVDALTTTRDRLAEAVDDLEDRRRELGDPEELELIARRELGLVKPGEKPYVVVRPEEELGQVHPETTEEPPAEEPWYRRLGRALGLVD